MPGFAMFIKDLVTKKRMVNQELAHDLHHCGAIVTRSLMQKNEDLGALNIPCTIRVFNFAKALCDLGANINLMPLAVFKQLSLGSPTLTTM